MYCIECLMRYRMAVVEETGAEPDFHPQVLAAHVSPAHTMIQGQAVCLPHFVACVQVQKVSAIVGPDGGQIVTSPLAIK